MSLYQPSRLFINSDDKISGTHNDFTVELPDSIVKPTGAMVTFASIPNLLYSFGKHQTTLYWKAQYPLSFVSVGGTTSPNTVLATPVPALSSKVTKDLTALCTAINAAIVSNTYVSWDANPLYVNMLVSIPDNAILEFTEDTATKKLKFTCRNATNPGVVFMGWEDPSNGGKYYNNLSYWLSFPNKQTPPQGTWWTSEAVYVSQGYPYAFPSLLRTENIYVMSDFSNGDNQGTSGRKDVLVKIPVQGSDIFGSIIQYQDSIGYFSIVKLPSVLRRMRFYLTDDDYQPLGLPDEGPGGVSIELILKYD